MTAAAVPAPSMFAVFRKRDFSLLRLAQLVSTAGSSLTDLAAGIWVYRETGSALAVGLTLMATAVPSLIVGLLAGVYVDRHDRKRILIVTCLVQAVIVATIAFVIGIEAIAVVGLYALILLNAGVKQFFDPAHDSLIPELATDEELLAANAFLSIASFGSTAIGFAGAGLLASTVDLNWAFIIDSGTFVSFQHAKRISGYQVKQFISSHQLGVSSNEHPFLFLASLPTTAIAHLNGKAILP